MPAFLAGLLLYVSNTTATLTCVGQHCRRLGFIIKCLIRHSHSVKSYDAIHHTTFASASFHEVKCSSFLPVWGYK